MNQISISNREAYETLITIVRNSKINFVQMGSLLKHLKDNDNYKESVGEMSWEDFVKQPEIGLTVGEANRLAQIYETFCEKFGLSIDKVSEIPIKNLHYLLPIAKDSSLDDVKDLIDDAEHLSQKDFKERVFERKHEDSERTYEFLIMKKCIETGNLSKVHDISSEEIKSKFNL